MKKSDFYYELPEELIAQSPLEPRDSARLLKIEREMGGLCHSRFLNLPDFLNSGDLLILNDSKVFPARLFADNSEVLLLEQKNKTVWECIGTRLKKGAVFNFGEALSGEITDILPGGNRLIKFSYDGDFYEILSKIGNMPTPPYITRKLVDPARYNTIYARETGSAAAPTAGLHFTERIFESLKRKGVLTAYVTLHVGLGTFRPVKTEDVSKHEMHAERYNLLSETMRKIRECKTRGNRVIAVGTTTCRVLETWAGEREQARNNTDKQCDESNPDADKDVWGSADLFITPGYEFKIIDGLLTNFHLPESTLIMLVSAFLGREKTLFAYEEAIKKKYRFFSFGDCMIIL